MLALECYEARLDALARRYPEMPEQTVKLVRFAFFLQRRLDDRLAKVLAGHGLAHSAWSLLMLIHSDPQGAVHPSGASELLRLSRPHLTRMADDLVARGWLYREACAGDRRAVVLRLSAEGERAVESLLPVMWQEYETLLAGLSGEEGAQMTGLLRKWLSHLEPAEEEMKDGVPHV